MENIDISQLNIPISTNVVDLETGSRNLRNQLLRDHVDTFNPIRYAALTNAQQVELANYRTALLDIPQQEGWPTAVAWPTKPTWI